MWARSHRGWRNLKLKLGFIFMSSWRSQYFYCISISMEYVVQCTVTSLVIERKVFSDFNRHTQIKKIVLYRSTRESILFRQNREVKNVVLVAEDLTQHSRAHIVFLVIPGSGHSTHAECPKTHTHALFLYITYTEKKNVEDIILTRISHAHMGKHCMLSPTRAESAEVTCVTAERNGWLSDTRAGMNSVEMFKKHFQ